MNRFLPLSPPLTLPSSPALAGIADRPLPVLMPRQPTYHLVSVPGIRNDDGSNQGTCFSCTSTSASAITVGIELFAAAGGGLINSAAATALSVATGVTVGFGTVNPADSWIDQNLAAPAMANGSARILSTSKSLICTAFVADVGNTPVSTRALTIVVKLKQKAAN